MGPEVITLEDEEEKDFSKETLTDMTNRRKRASGIDKCQLVLNSGTKKRLLPAINRHSVMEPEVVTLEDDEENNSINQKHKVVTLEDDEENNSSKQVSEDLLTPADFEVVKYDFSNATNEEDNIPFSLKNRESFGLKNGREKGIKRLSPDFEVDFIVDSKTEDGKVHYLVKWSKYPAKFSSWVSAANMKAPKLIEEFNLHTLAVQVILKKLRPDQETFASYFGNRYNQRNRRRWKLLQIQFNWNMLIGEQGARIYIENWSEKFQKLPAFEYIKKSIYSDQVKEALESLDLSDVPVGCGENCKCKNMKGCCAKEHNGVNYTLYSNVHSMRTIISSNKIQVIECGDHCKCDPEVCRQRVVQKGRTIPLVLFYEGKKGWGVRTVYKIPKRTFVGEYVGEVIPLSEAELPSRTSTYQFGLREKLPTLNDEMLVIDAKDFGNETRFINHSCDPNLHARELISNKYGAYDIRIAFFAARDIEPGEEMTFDYYQDEEKSKKYSRTNMRCRCGASKCREFLPSK